MIKLLLIIVTILSVMMFREIRLLTESQTANTCHQAAATLSRAEPRLLMPPPVYRADGTDHWTVSDQAFFGDDMPADHASPPTAEKSNQTPWAAK